MKRLLFTLLLLGASLQARPPETIPNDTPEGLLLCGYQGWFNTPGDGSGRGWRHYRGTDGRFDADSAGIDCWPDIFTDPVNFFPPQSTNITFARSGCRRNCK